MTQPVSSRDFSQPSATRLLTFLNFHREPLDGSLQVTVELTLENTVIPTTLRHVVLSLDDLELLEEAAADSLLLDKE